MQQPTDPIGGGGSVDEHLRTGTGAERDPSPLGSDESFRFLVERSPIVTFREEVHPDEGTGSSTLYISPQAETSPSAWSTGFRGRTCPTAGCTTKPSSWTTDSGFHDGRACWWT